MTGNCLYHIFMVIWGMVYYCFTHIVQLYFAHFWQQCLALTSGTNLSRSTHFGNCPLPDLKKKALFTPMLKSKYPYHIPLILPEGTLLHITPSKNSTSPTKGVYIHTYIYTRIYIYTYIYVCMYVCNVM